MRILLIVFMAGFLFSCGTQRRLHRLYTGQPVSALEKEFGHPQTIIPNREDSIYIYENKKELRSTEISQGKLTLDPIVSPPAVKTERYYFTVDNGIITDVRREEEYER